MLWFTGLSGAGKSTIANLVEKQLQALGHHTMILDGDNVRHGLNRDLGFTEADRVENIRRIAEVSHLFVEAGVIVLVSFISPYRSERMLARDCVDEGEFLEIFVDTPIEECCRRDPKGLYQKAYAGQIRNFTGVDAPYEEPLDPEIRLRTLEGSAEDLAGPGVAELRTWHHRLTDTLETVSAEALACPVCAPHLPLGPRPVFRVSTTARLLIIGQAPGTKVHETGIPWNDPSGERLRGWLAMDRDTFYDESRIAIVPMGLCYPGRLPNGGDAPPRPECAPLWHGPVRAADAGDPADVAGRDLCAGAAAGQRRDDGAGAGGSAISARGDAAAASVLADDGVGAAESLVRRGVAAGAEGSGRGGAARRGLN